MYSKNDYIYIQDAVKFLHTAFINPEDRNKPELLHSLHVGFRLMRYEYSVDVVIAGFLHDVIEEGVGGDQISEKFGGHVYDLVKANSKDETLATWQEQYTELIKRCYAHSEQARSIKAADILDNMVYSFNAPYVQGQEKMLFGAKEFFKYVDSNEGVIGELRTEYNKHI